MPRSYDRLPNHRAKNEGQRLDENPSSQIDTDAHWTVKGGRKYFGYKGHIGADVGSNVIRRRAFTSAQPHDSQLKEVLFSGDEKAIFGDRAYSNKADKQKARKEGVYYGILDKETRKRGLFQNSKKEEQKQIKSRL